MTKIAILIFHNMKYCPYLNTYINILKNINNISYDIVFFNREKQLNEISNDNVYKIDWIGKYSNNKINKMLNFINYYYKTKKILDNNRYDKIIVLTTIPGVILSKYLIKNYYKKYIMDVRDYTWEKIPFYYKREKMLFNSSLLNVISSPEFTKFLPKSNYLLCHNLNINEVLLNKRIEKNKNDIIQISYIGSIAYEDNCIKLINLVKNDNRFSFYFYGNETNGKIVSNYIFNLNCDRIKYFGPYMPNQTEELFEKADLVFNCYGNETSLVKYAISNKYYFGLAYHRPLLVSPDTTMSSLVGNYGYSLDLKTAKNLNDLFEWYNRLDENEFDTFAKKHLEESIQNNKIAIKKITEAIMEDKNDR